MKRMVIDTETGEIIDELYGGDRILKQNSIEYLKSRTNFNDCKFIKVQNSLFYTLNEMNGNECKVFLGLLKYVRYETGAITYENGKIIKISDLASEINISESTLKRGIKGLLKLEIIKKGKYDDKNMYFMNPFVCFKGSKITIELIKMFEDSRFNQSK